MQVLKYNPPASRVILSKTTVYQQVNWRDVNRDPRVNNNKTLAFGQFPHPYFPVTHENTSTKVNHQRKKPKKSSPPKEMDQTRKLSRIITTTALKRTEPLPAPKQTEIKALPQYDAPQTTELTKEIARIYDSVFGKPETFLLFGVPIDDKVEEGEPIQTPDSPIAHAQEVNQEEELIKAPEELTSMKVKVCIDLTEETDTEAHEPDDTELDVPSFSFMKKKRKYKAALSLDEELEAIEQQHDEFRTTSYEALHYEQLKSLSTEKTNVKTRRQIALLTGRPLLKPNSRVVKKVTLEQKKEAESKGICICNASLDWCSVCKPYFWWTNKNLNQ